MCTCSTMFPLWHDVDGNRCCAYARSEREKRAHSLYIYSIIILNLNWLLIQTHGNTLAATILMFSCISCVCHVLNPYWSCWSHDHHVSSTQCWTAMSTVQRPRRVATVSALAWFLLPKWGKYAKVLTCQGHRSFSLTCLLWRLSVPFFLTIESWI